MRIGHRDALCIEDALDALQNVKIDGPVVTVLHPETQRVFDGVVAVAAHAGKDRLNGQHARIVCRADKRRLDLFHIVVIACGNAHHDAAVFLGGEVRDAGRDGLAVGDGDELSVYGCELRAENANLAHGALHPGDLHEISKLVRLGGQQHDGARHIAQRILDGKGDRQTCDAEDGKQGGGVDPERPCDEHDGDEYEHHLHKRPDEAVHGGMYF